MKNLMLQGKVIVLPVEHKIFNIPSISCITLCYCERYNKECIKTGQNSI